MKFNIEVEVDWIEEGGLDDEIKRQMVNGIVHSLGNKYVETIAKDAQKQLQSTVDQLIANTYEGFLDKGVDITDRYGDVKRSNIQVSELIKERFDKFLLEKVDKEGRPSDYSAVGTRFEYMIDQRVKKAAEALTKDIVGQVDAKVAAQLNKTVRDRLSDSLLQKIDVDTIVKSAVGEFTKSGG